MYQFADIFIRQKSFAVISFAEITFAARCPKIVKNGKQNDCGQSHICFSVKY